MDDQVFVRLETKLDKVSERISSIDVTIGKQQVSLDDHILRTNLLEAKIEPLEKQMNMFSGALKLIGLAASIAAAGEGLVAVLKYIGITI